MAIGSSSRATLSSGGFQLPACRFCSGNFPKEMRNGIQIVGECACSGVPLR
jgi:hypothetical protein